MKILRPIRIEGNIAYIPLTQGYEAKIDSTDVPLVDGFNWRAQVAPNSVYARCLGPRPKRETILLHRLLTGFPEGMQVDHRDGDGLNCQRANLRIATHAENQRNQRLTKQNTSGYKGVGWNKRDKAWQARIRVNGKLRHLGYFGDPVEAYAAYCKASAELHGEFGRVK